MGSDSKSRNFHKKTGLPNATNKSMEQNVSITHLDWTLIPLNRQKERCNNTWYDKENQRHGWWMFLLQPFIGNEFISLMKIEIGSPFNSLP
jgi:hypothetical protein